MPLRMSFKLLHWFRICSIVLRWHCDIIKVWWEYVVALPHQSFSCITLSYIYNTWVSVFIVFAAITIVIVLEQICIYICHYCNLDFLKIYVITWLAIPLAHYVIVYCSSCPEWEIASGTLSNHAKIYIFYPLW